MTSRVLTISNVGKRYVLQHQAGGGPRDLRETVVDGLARIGRRLRRGPAGLGEGAEEFWALRDVSLEIEEGDVVGILGRNGAGKSTLLRLLSRITEPTTGEIRIRGRVGSLLEVGTGFHPDLTGRENIFLNGAILGMSRAEIRRKFERIVQFSEIERFLDTPVKHYSSGMYVRLAFSVAAHLDPEILIVDEVLAVGDAAFQKKCLGRMSEVADEGRTILFVSHNVALIRSICRRGILIESGAIRFDGAAEQAANIYLAGLESTSGSDLEHHPRRRGEGRVRLTSIEVGAPGEGDTRVLESARPARFVFRTSRGLPGTSCSFTLYDALGQPVSCFDSALAARDDCDGGAGQPGFVCDVEHLMLIPGRYRLNAALTCDGHLQDHVEGAAVFEVREGASTRRAMAAEPGYGSAFMHHRWIRAREGSPGGA
jgi:lipopolysaccharide transport system ATP-binding protein